ncbi:hypothetical protein Plhal703r1_c31g0121991 [Plasmopara halstedii]
MFGIATDATSCAALAVKYHENSIAPAQLRRIYFMLHLTDGNYLGSNNSGVLHKAPGISHC